MFSQSSWPQGGGLRHVERASTILTTNKGFEEWGAVLGDEVMATAMLDSLLHRCHVVNIQGSSCRMREYRSRYKAQEKIREQEEEKNFQGRAPEVDKSGTFFLDIDSQAEIG